MDPKPPFEPIEGRVSQPPEPVRMSFSGPGAKALKHQPERAQQLATALVYGTRAQKREAEQYLKKHRIVARSGAVPADECRT